MIFHPFGRSTSARCAFIAAAIPLTFLFRGANASNYFTETENYVVYTTFGTGGSSIVYKDTTDTGPLGAGSIAEIPGDTLQDTAIILHAVAAANNGAAHFNADAQFVRNFHTAANYNIETYKSSSHVIMTLDDIIITGPGPGPVTTSINVLLDGAISAASSVADNPNAIVSGSSSVSVGVFANNVHIGDGFYTVSSTNGISGSPFGSGLFANFTGHNVVTTDAITLPVNTPVTIKFDLSLDAAAGLSPDTGGNALSVAIFGDTISFATDRPVFNLPEGYSVNSVSAGISGNTFAVPEPSTLPLLATGAALLRRRRRRAAC